jgi:ethanolamine ammonia-lyase small subunit
VIRSDDREGLRAAGWPEIVRRVRARTPARLLEGRAGAGYRTETQLELREAHAAARDAVRAELDLHAIFGASFLERWRLFETSTRARSKDQFLLRPDLGRHFDDASRHEIARQCTEGGDLQIAVGDGLSVPAVAAQAPALIPLLHEAVTRRGWSTGRAFVIRHCRVGILNEIGELLKPVVAVLLIGERPGLATAESLSAYMAYRPESNHTDANRNLISNIHARGLSAAEAAERIVELAERMKAAKISGWQLKTGDRHSAPAIGRATDKNSVDSRGSGQLDDE